MSNCYCSVSICQLFISGLPSNQPAVPPQGLAEMGRSWSGVMAGGGGGIAAAWLSWQLPVQQLLGWSAISAKTTGV